MAVSSIGVGSGLPLNELLADLRAAENHSLALIQSRQTSVTARLTGYGTLKGAIDGLKSAAQALEKAETFGALSTSVSGDAFTATASTKGIAGQYSIKVDALATRQTLAAQGLEARNSIIADDVADGAEIKVTIKLRGDGEDAEPRVLTLKKEDTTLDGLVKAINADSKLGVSATIVNDGSDAPHRLLLTSRDTGVDAGVMSIEIAETGEAEGSTKLREFLGVSVTMTPGDPNTPPTYDKSGALTLQQDALDASLDINGIRVTSGKNTVSDVIEGITLQLSKTTSEAQTLTVTRDDSKASAAVNAFVTAYNKLQSTIKSLTSFNVENQTQSALTGDSLARSVQNQLRQALNVALPDAAIGTLSQLGITTNPSDGMLQVDDAKLKSALTDKLDDVKRLLTGDNGLSKSIAKAADVFIKSDGLIPNATDSINDTLKGLDKQYLATQERIDAKMENYRRQFVALDSMMAQMNSLSSYLTQQLSMLGSMNEKK